MNIQQGEHAKRFGFGKNWESFLTVVDDDRVREAKESLKTFIGLETLEGKTFLDIGSGSGLFSYAAFLLGAEQIMSFDFDADSVAATKQLWKEAGMPDQWRIEQGSVLDRDYIETLGKFDIVYSWGVLHHTGSMWEAIRNAAEAVRPGGFFYIALYNRVEGGRSSEFWLGVKHRYTHGGALTRRLIEWTYFCVYHIALPLVRLQNPFTVMREYRKNRGMDYWRDVVDWVGGYPYEYATVQEVFAFMKKEYPTHRLENVTTTNSLGNNEFLFKDSEGHV